MSNSHLLFLNRFEVGQEDWDTFVDASDEAWLWHRFDLQDAISTLPGKHDLSFAIRGTALGERIVAVIPLHLIEKRRIYAFKWNTLDSLGGPACANGLGVKQKRKILEYAMSQITDLARKYDAVEINFALSPMAPAYCGERCPRINPLLEMGCENTLTQTWVVDIRQGKEKLWMNMETRARNAIRKAEKEGLRVRPANGSDDLDIYYHLHCETYRRTGVPPHPKSYFEAIWRNFLSKDLSLIFFAEWKENVVAAENFGAYKKAAVYWTGAANSQGLTLQANSLLQWAAMQSMVENGIEWYETGEAFPHLREGKLKGLNNFKRSFGGELFPYYRGRIVFSPKWHSLWRFIHTWRTNT
ncbi:MAG: GNAT family N-acetyltransferase [Thermodesulfobacteriota bacterium]